jgi:hypothetical protein
VTLSGETVRAFGLELELQSGIDLPGLVEEGGERLEGISPLPFARVYLQPDEVERRWRPYAASAARVREQRVGRLLALSVDFAEPVGYLLRAQGVGRVLVARDGGELFCDPEASCAEWSQLLSAQALPLAATLAGREVLHAAGIRLSAGAVLFSGAPGIGKSSLAAAFLRRGASLLSDDAVALEWGPTGIVAHPGVGAVHLRNAEHERLSDAERASLGSTQPFAARQRYLQITTGPAPMAALFLLERASSGSPVERIVDCDPFALLGATFNVSVRTPERLMRQLDLIEALIASERIFRLRILPGTDATQLAAIVERELVAILR